MLGKTPSPAGVNNGGGRPINFGALIIIFVVVLAGVPRFWPPGMYLPSLHGLKKRQLHSRNKSEG